MACGLPVLASRLGAVPELVDRPGRNGLLVAPGDVSALAAGMSALARDEALRARMGAAARARVLAEYTLELMIERTEEVYSVACDRFDRGQ
jgi:glycosyltransferase involved in cell wall biosynthesis